MTFRTEFNEKNYPDVFVDHRIRKVLRSHYCADTSVVLAAVSYGRSRNLMELPISKWYAERPITLYQPILEELYGKLRFDGHSPVTNSYETSRRKLRRMLNTPNSRFVFDESLSVRNWRKTLNSLNPEKGKNLIDNVSKNRISSVDAVLLAISDYEGGEVVTFDELVSEIGYKYEIPVHYILFDKLPKDFKGDWSKWKEKRLD
jgi:predicted nucleic acid-binding protein